MLFASAGHAASVPVQVSAGSHAPADGRHSTVAGCKVSAGQETLVPVHVSATSQTSAAARHSVPAVAGGWMHRPLPSHWSALQTLPSSAHAVPLAAGVPVHFPA